jgi:hypothetical protein
MITGTRHHIQFSQLSPHDHPKASAAP